MYIYVDKIDTLRCMPDSTILVTADIVGLYSSIPIKPILLPLRKRLTRDF